MKSFTINEFCRRYLYWLILKNMRSFKEDQGDMEYGGRIEVRVYARSYLMDK